MKKDIYIAAPLFNSAEIAFNESIYNVLSPYFKVYLPQKNGDLLADLLESGLDLKYSTRKIFMQDISAIEKSEFLLIVLNGRSIDEGACFELGYAYANKKKCFALQTDTRRLLPTGNNPMIEESVTKIFKSINELEEWAKKQSP